MLPALDRKQLIHLCTWSSHQPAGAVIGFGKPLLLDQLLSHLPRAVGHTASWLCNKTGYESHVKPCVSHVRVMTAHLKQTQSLSDSSSPTNTLHYVLQYNEVLYICNKQTGTEQSMHCKLQLSMNTVVHKAEGCLQRYCLPLKESKIHVFNGRAPPWRSTAFQNRFRQEHHSKINRGSFCQTSCWDI